MFSTHPRGSYINERISRKYSKEVLLADWKELRMGSEEKNDCITPGLKRVNACEKHLSEFQDQFYAPCEPGDCDDSTRLYLDARNEALHNYKRNTETQVRFPLSADMSNNYTTTYNIMYDILPKYELKALAEHPTGDGHAKRTQVELLQSYGNRTRTGSRCRQRLAQTLDNKKRMQTTYVGTFGNAAKSQPGLTHL